MDMLHATADPMALIYRVGALIDAGRCGAAGPLLAAARQLISPSPELSLLAARLAEGQGQNVLARDELDIAIAASPNHGELLKHRASLCHRTGDYERAARDAAEAVILDPADPDAKALLGSALLSLGHPSQAQVCLSEANAARPGNAAFREALAIATEANGDQGAAFAILMEGLSSSGGALSLRNAAIVSCIRRRDFPLAISLADEGRIAGTVDACLFGLKGHAQSSLCQHEAAAESYAEALKLAPDDPYVRHLVAASGMVPGSNRAPPDYLRVVFDGYAERFDEHLIALGYRIPGTIRRVVADYADTHAPCPVLDLGCGTGLTGLAVADLAIGPLTGVDVSSRMLAEASAKGLYASLEQADALDWLAENTASWGLVLAGDMLCYFGALEQLLGAVCSRLGSGGWFVFSVEEQQPSGDSAEWVLHRQGRYAHTWAYVEKAVCLAGLSVKAISREVIRQEAGAPVPGILVVAERMGAMH